MLFHVTWETYPTVVLDDEKRLREAVGPQLQRLMQSEKVREAGILSGQRAGFFLVDIDAPEELQGSSGQRSSPTSRWRRTPLRPWTR